MLSKISLDLGIYLCNVPENEYCPYRKLFLDCQVMVRVFIVRILISLY